MPDSVIHQGFFLLSPGIKALLEYFFQYRTSSAERSVSGHMIEIGGLKEHVVGLKGILCDLWGVVHNGRAAFPEAVEALQALRKKGLFLVLLSNSPRPSISVRAQLKDIGVPGNCYDAIITSGDISREFLIGEGADKTFFHLGPERDQPTIEGLPNPETDDLRRADYILCTGFFEDWSMDPKSYEALFAAGVQNQIPMICANPDKEAEIDNKRVLCAGTLASLYERMGGKIHWFGKPDEIAYQKCFDIMKLQMKDEFKPADLLAIGDNLETDIRGGKAQGLKTLFIAEGLHGKHGTTQEELEPFMKKLDIFPDMFMKRLKW
ncbi:MAG: TIGR01459 family HAD-type hydrolase [Proteobacteria bacterium]|nr:TIGR01459 family HAD-type hydrolase [Pseudomonadota bacterium]